jgi:hypothetical protein
MQNLPSSLSRHDKFEVAPVHLVRKGGLTNRINASSNDYTPEHSTTIKNPQFLNWSQRIRASMPQSVPETLPGVTHT